jgi:hypothetical protein
MAYSDFTVTKFEQRFNIRQTRAELFARPIQTVQPSTLLLETISSAERMPLFSEKAKSEMLIAPILLEILRQNEYRFTIFSGFSFDIDPLTGLNGLCDFLLSTEPDSIEIKAPVFCIVEAKNRTVEEGIGQCAAEMYAARLFNAASDKPTPVVYGTVTNAYDWVFLRLEEQTLTVDRDRYYLGDLPQLLGVLQTIVAMYR